MHILRGFLLGEPHYIRSKIIEVPNNQIVRTNYVSVSRTIDVSQWKLIRDREHVSKYNIYCIQYYKKICMSNHKLFTISNS